MGNSNLAFGEYALGAIGSAAIQSAGTRKSQKRARDYTLVINKQMQEWQERMWRMANDYNLPVNEVQRLLDAGINPALAFSNGGASAAPVPGTSSASVGAPSSSVPNLGEAVRAAQGQEGLDIQSEVADSVVDRNKAEAEKLRSEASESGSRKSLNEAELKIRQDPAYISAMAAHPGIRNKLDNLSYDMNDLDYQFSLGTYGYRMESAALGLDQQKLNFITGVAQLRNVVRTYTRLGAEIDYLDSLGGKARAEAKVLRQDLDIRAGKAYLGTLQRKAIQYCVEHGVEDSVTGEIRSFIPLLADEYASGVVEGLYSSRSVAQTAHEEEVYQKEHGQEKRELEQELTRRKGNYYRTIQWTASINTAASFFKTVVDAGATISTRGLSKAGSSLITPKSGSEPVPLSSEALDVLRKISPEVDEFMIPW